MPGDFPLTLSHWGTHLFNKSFLQEYLTAGQAPSRRLSSSQVLRAIEKLFTSCPAGQALSQHLSCSSYFVG